MCETINDSHADVFVRMVGIAVLTFAGTACGKDIGAVKFGVQRIGLTCVDHEENLIVPLQTFRLATQSRTRER